MKQFRDGYFSESTEGKQLIQEYYDIAPTIVKRIDRQENRKELYQDLYEEYLVPCIRKIEEQDYEACKTLYQDMVLKLKERYIQ